MIPANSRAMNAAITPKRILSCLGSACFWGFLEQIFSLKMLIMAIARLESDMIAAGISISQADPKRSISPAASQCMGMLVPAGSCAMAMRQLTKGVATAMIQNNAAKRFFT